MRVRKGGKYANCHKIREFEREIIWYMYKGVSASLIAGKMFVSYATVTYHIRKIERITGLNPRTVGGIQKLYETYAKEEKNERT